MVLAGSIFLFVGFALPFAFLLIAFNNCFCLSAAALFAIKSANTLLRFNWSRRKAKRIAATPKPITEPIKSDFLSFIWEIT